MRRSILILILFAWLLPISLSANTPRVYIDGASPTDDDAIHWEAWSDTVFERAKRENRFVLLDLEAVWCHWCHVMDEITYKDPAVISLIKSRYIAVRVDQDSRPDLSNRYEDYGWPATIVFNANGGEIIKRSGYMTPKEMASVLRAIIADPTPGPSVVPERNIRYANTAVLPVRLRQQLHAIHLSHYDFKRGGWGFIHKYLDWDSVEYCMLRAKAGDARAERMARQTLTAELALLDPVWGGFYQYSVGDWNEPHFEKILPMQTENMRIYAQAYTLWGDPLYLRAAVEVHRYLRAFLTSPEGVFYTSQDADLIKGEHSAGYFSLGDAERRKLGIPKVDTHIYARENGWVINGLVALYSATGEAEYLEEARRAAQWVIENRSLPGGGFRHDSVDVAGPYLGDTLSMGRAFISLYTATGERQWLTRAEEAVGFIAENFKGDPKTGQFPGFATMRLSQNTKDAFDKPRPQRDENILMARFANLLFYYTGNTVYRQLAEQAMKYLATPEIAKRRPTGGVLLANSELTSEPVHITVVGGKDDPQARILFKAALSYPSGYKRVEWWDRREGLLPNPDVEYPELKTAAAFACANRRCSLPAFKPEDIRARVDRLK